MSAQIAAPALTTLPPLADAMTAADLWICEHVIASLIGGDARVMIMTSGHAGQHVQVAVYPSGITRDRGRQTFSSSTWPEAIRAAHAYAATYAPVQRNATIRRMALAVISLTDEHGTCTEAALIRQNFTAAEVADLHELACERAGEMAGNQPFVVVRASLDVGAAS